MPTVRICSVNGEWMNDWFTADAEPVAFRPTCDRDGGKPNDTTQTATRLAAMITAIKPHVVAIEEGPQPARRARALRARLPGRRLRRPAR